MGLLYDISTIKDRPHLTADDVAFLLTKSKSVAYKIIKDLNADLAKEGFYTVSGRVSKKYFAERFNIDLSGLCEGDGGIKSGLS